MQSKSHSSRAKRRREGHQGHLSITLATDPTRRASRVQVHLLPQTYITRRLALSYMGVAPLATAKSWDGPTFPRWTPAFVDRILTDSPWARSSTVNFELQDNRRFAPATFNQIGLPGGIPWPGGGSRKGPSGSSVRTEIFLITRWASALPVRQAMALQEFGPAGLQSDRAVELLTRVEPEYVLEVAGFPTTIIRQGAERFEGELLKSAKLSFATRSARAAVSSSVPPYGMHLVASLRFPRLLDLTSKDTFVEFTAEAGPLRVNERWKLRDMEYYGRLEL